MEGGRRFERAIFCHAVFNIFYFCHAFRAVHFDFSLVKAFPFVRCGWMSASICSSERVFRFSRCVIARLPCYMALDCVDSRRDLKRYELLLLALSEVRCGAVRV